MQTPITTLRPGAENAMVATKLASASIGALLRDKDKTSERKQIITDHDALNRDQSTYWGSTGDQGPSATATLDPKADTLCIAGQSPSGRRFRIRFVPKNVAAGSAGRRA